MPIRVKLKTIAIVLPCAIIPALYFYLGLFLSFSAALKDAMLAAAAAWVIMGLYLLYIFIPQFDLRLLRIKLRTRGRKIAVLTFDDGPEPPWTEEILDILLRHNVRAAFFVSGAKARLCPAVLQRMIKEGHEVCNHAMSHRPLAFCKRDEMEREIMDAQAAIEEGAGRRPLFFRPPRGFKTPAMRKVLCKAGLELVPWTKGVWDTDGSACARLLARWQRSFNDLEIIVLHDGLDMNAHSKTRRETVLFLDEAIKGYKRMGYTFMTLSALFALFALCREKAGGKLPEMETAAE